MNDHKDQEEDVREVEIVFRNPCYQCGLPVNFYDDIGLCDECGRADREEKEMELLDYE